MVRDFGRVKIELNTDKKYNTKKIIVKVDDEIAYETYYLVEKFYDDILKENAIVNAIVRHVADCSNYFKIDKIVVIVKFLYYLNNWDINKIIDVTKLCCYIAETCESDVVEKNIAEALNNCDDIETLMKYYEEVKNG